MINKKILISVIFTFFLFLPSFLFAETNNSKQIKILIVPGHDNEAWGAKYGNIKEADMNLVLATNIYNLLKKDKRFKVYISRNSLGYTKIFSEYFSSDRDNIIEFKSNAKKNILKKIERGSILKKDNVPHVSVNQEIAIKLYGFNKWANENDIDLVLHVHFNDYPREDEWKIGKYKGFAVYVPESQMENSKESIRLAESIFKELKKKYQISDYPKEKNGIIQDQTLIAIGANHTLEKDIRSVLVEYGYVYQKIFRKSSTRHQAYKDMANLTVTGIKNYFFGK